MKTYISSAIVLASLALLSVVGTAQAATCSIDSFVASPATVLSGGSTTLTISTTGCDTAKVAGLDPNNIDQAFTVQANGSMSSGAITSARKFTLEASSGTGAPVTASVTVSMNGGVAVASPSTKNNAFVATNETANVLNATASADATATTHRGFFATIGHAISGLVGLVANAISALVFWK